MTPQPGVIVADKYRLERPLAAGGMGAVWVAQHVELEVAVAVKFISDQDSGTEEARARFRREAKAAAQLKSPHVTRIQDYGVEHDTPYIVMELLEGEDLSQLLEREGALTLERAAHIVEQVCRALAEAHEMRIVHRDLKPSNIFLARMGGQQVVKILDFGIAKKMGPSLEGEFQTRTGVMVGSPHYMSPEQLRVESLDGRSDLWSLAVVLYELLTGAPPFHAEYPSALIGKILTESAQPVSSRVSGLPPDTDRFFERAMALDRENRFDSVTSFAAALSALAAGEPLPPLRLPTQPDTPPHTAAATYDDSVFPRSGPTGEVRALSYGDTKPAAGIAHEHAAARGKERTTTSHAVRVVDARDATKRLRRPRAWLLALLPLIAIAGAVGWLVGRDTADGRQGGGAATALSVSLDPEPSNAVPAASDEPPVPPHASTLALPATSASSAPSADPTVAPASKVGKQPPKVTPSAPSKSAPTANPSAPPKPPTPKSTGGNEFGI